MTCLNIALIKGITHSKIVTNQSLLRDVRSGMKIFYELIWILLAIPNARIHNGSFVQQGICCLASSKLASILQHRRRTLTWAVGMMLLLQMLKRGASTAERPTLQRFAYLIISVAMATTCSLWAILRRVSASLSPLNIFSQKLFFIVFWQSVSISDLRTWLQGGLFCVESESEVERYQILQPEANK